MKEFILDGVSLDIETIYLVAVAKPGEIKVTIKPEAREKMVASRQFVDDIVESGKAVYGINTGFGALSDKFIEKKDLSKLQYNLIRSHCTGVGNPFSIITTRAIMLLRANCLVSGFSGVTATRSPIESMAQQYA